MLYHLISAATIHTVNLPCRGLKQDIAHRPFQETTLHIVGCVITKAILVLDTCEN